MGTGSNGNPDAVNEVAVLNDVWDAIQHSLRIGPAGGGLVASKAITFTGAAGLGAVGTFPLFTVTGQVLLCIIGICGTTLVGATATVKVGNATTTNRYNPQVTATTITAGGTVDSTGLVTAPTAPLVTPNQSGQNAEAIIGTVATAAITAGQMTYYAFYRPLSAGATVA